MTKKINKFIYWAPRIMSIAFILFLALFSFDVFGAGAGFWKTALGLFIHNIPALILLIVLLISWKHEIVGGIAFIAAGIAYIALIATNTIKGPFEWYVLSYSLIIAGPAFLIGILFLVNWSKNKSVPKK